MPVFRYTGDQPRVFPGLGLTLDAGAEVEAEENPDELWFGPAKATKKAAAPVDPEGTA